MSYQRSTHDEAQPDGPNASNFRLIIRVLGGFSLARGETRLDMPNRRARALMGYIALAGDAAVSRDRLAGLLWSDVGDKQARNSLRQTLFDLRGSLGSEADTVLQIDRDSISLARDYVWLDLDGAIAGLSRGEVASALLRPGSVDGILAGLEDISPLFSDWLSSRRRQVVDSLRRAAAAGYADESLPTPARRRAAEACLSLDPLDEGACRTAMRLAAEAGETSAALRLYAALYERLGEELDMEPSAATQALVADIKLGTFEALEVKSGLPQEVAATRDLDHVGQSEPPARAASTFFGVPVVAVLPFRTIGLTSIPAALAEGLVEDVVGILARLREPVVISSHSTRLVQEPHAGLVQLGEQLGAQYFVNGSIRSQSGQARINVQLSVAATGVLLWSRQYEVREQDLLSAQDEIAASIGHTLAPHVNAMELRSVQQRRPEDLNAYHLLLRAREIMYRLDRTTFAQAGAMLRSAAALDPRYPAIHATLADWHSLMIFQNWSEDRKHHVDALLASAQEALRLDPGNAAMLAFLGHNLTLASRRYADAFQMFDRALDCGPNVAEAWMWSSSTYAYTGAGPEAVRRAERALALSPDDPFLFRYESFRCLAHYASGDYDGTVFWGFRSLLRNSNYTATRRHVAAALVGLGRPHEAKEVAAPILDAIPEFRVEPLIAGSAYSSLDRRETYGRQLIEAGLPP